MAMTYNEDGTVKKTKGNKKATPFKEFKDDAVKTPLRLIEVIKRLKKRNQQLNNTKKSTGQYK